MTTTEDDFTTVTHLHAYDREIADWWCHDCETVTDYCQQINPS